MGGCATTRVSLSDPRPYVRKVLFQRVDEQGRLLREKMHVSEKVLRGKILVQSESINPLARTDNRVDNPFVFDVDTQGVSAFYRDHGYFNTRVSVRFTPCGSGSDMGKAVGVVDVYFCILEGAPTYVNQVWVKGIAVLPPATRQSLLKQLTWRDRLATADSIPPPSTRWIVDQEICLREKDRLLEWLRQEGYAFAKGVKRDDLAKKGEGSVSAEDGVDVYVDRTKRLAEVWFSIDPGQQTRFGDIKVEGCQQTYPEAVAKHAGIVSGDIYRPLEIELARGKLYQLGVFGLVQIQVVPRAQHPDVADVLITVKETAPQEMQLGVGLGIEPLRTEARAQVAYTHHNIGRRLEKLRIQLQLGYAAVPAFWASTITRQGPTAGVDLLFEKPDVLGINSTLQLNMAYNVANEPAYSYHGPAFNAGIQKAFWRRRIQLGLSGHFQFLDFFNTEEAILQKDPVAAGALFGYTDPYRLSYLRQSIVLDLRDRPIDATKGLYVGLLAEEGGVYTGSAFDFQKLVPEVRAYGSLFKGRWVFAGRLQFGQLFSQGEFGSPVTQRFYLGGPNSHRGFTYNRLSYQVCSGQANAAITCDVATDNVKRVPLGGDQMLLLQLETRVNLFQLLGQWVSLAAFVDSGDVAAPAVSQCTQSTSDPDKANVCEPVQYPALINLKQLHVAVGGGLRYKTLIGTVRFDVGVRVNRLGFQEDSGQVDSKGAPILYQNPDPGQQVVYHISIGEAF